MTDAPSPKPARRTPRQRRSQALVDALLDATARVLAARPLARALAAVMERLAPHADALRETDLALAGFIVGRALEEVVHAAVVERPDVQEHPRFAEELTHLVVACLRREGAAVA